MNAGLDSEFDFSLHNRRVEGKPCTCGWYARRLEHVMREKKRGLTKREQR